MWIVMMKLPVIKVRGVRVGSVPPLLRFEPPALNEKVLFYA